MRILVVGATGILAPVVPRLTVRGDAVTGVARSAGADIRVDAADAFALSAALGSTRWDAAIVYMPATSPTSLRIIDQAVGSVVRLLTSDAAAPGRPDPLASASVLLLGWTADGHHWHTPEEVSDAAIAVLDSGESAMLGVVRPWSDRPG